MDTGTLNYRWSQTLVAALVAAGVRHAVISPGSRSTPLALAMLRQPALKCTMTVDERSAAFFALGIGKATRTPALVLATSGTAPANWHPAVIEASHAGIPLLLLSADRPPSLQGWGANQTIAQTALFNTEVRAAHALPLPAADVDPAYLHQLAARIVAESLWPHPGPVHLNQPFSEPLLPRQDADALVEHTASTLSFHLPENPPAPAAVELLAKRISGQPGAIVCGELPADIDKKSLFSALTVLGERLGCPVLAEPLSGLRFGHATEQPNAMPWCVRYNRWLANTDFTRHAPAYWVLRFGPWPVTRHLQNFIAAAAWQAWVDPWPRWSDPQHRLDFLLRADPLTTCRALLAQPLTGAPTHWLACFDEGEQSMANSPGHDPAARRIAAIVNAAPADMPIFIGNSLAIREFDSHSGRSEKLLHLYANRGASGIDGNISTALGIAHSHGRVLALLGDLTTQHDLGALALARGLNAIIITVNNGGGGIFDHLPQASLPATEFQMGWRTPQHIDFSAAAQTFGLNFAQSSETDSLAAQIQTACSQGGPWLLEHLAP